MNAAPQALPQTQMSGATGLIDGIVTTARAVELIRRGFRPPIVASELKVPTLTVRAIYKEVFGHRPPSGRPRSMDNMLRYVSLRREISLFIVVYLALVTAFDDTVDKSSLEDIATAHRVYLSEREDTELPEEPHASAITASDAYMVVKNIRTSAVDLRHCDACGAMHIYHPTCGGVDACPFCDPRSRTL